MDKFASVIAGTASPTELFAPDVIGRIMGAAPAVQRQDAVVGKPVRLTY